MTQMVARISQIRRLGSEDSPALNPWKQELGCEVRVCEAQLCDRERMDICALRAAYLERRAELRKRLAECRSERIRGLLKGMLESLEGVNSEE